MSLQTFKIIADVTMNNSNINISNLSTIDLPPKFTSFTIGSEGVPFSALQAQTYNTAINDAYDRAITAADRAVATHIAGSDEWKTAYQNAVASEFELNRHFNARLLQIIYGQYYHIYDTLYIKNDFLTYIQFINNRWIVFFRFAGIFYCFYKRNNTDNKFMDIDSIKNGLFTNTNLQKFNTITNSIQPVTAFYNNIDIHLNIDINIIR